MEGGCENSYCVSACEDIAWTGMFRNRRGKRQTGSPTGLPFATGFHRKRGSDVDPPPPPSDWPALRPGPSQHWRTHKARPRAGGGRQQYRDVRMRCRRLVHGGKCNRCTVIGRLQPPQQISAGPHQTRRPSTREAPAVRMIHCFAGTGAQRSGCPPAAVQLVRSGLCWPGWRGSFEI